MAKPAENPGKGNGPKHDDASVSLVVNLVHDANGDGVINYNDHITFTVTELKPNVSWQQVNLAVYQGEQLVASAIYPLQNPIVLNSNTWDLKEDKAADAVAECVQLPSAVLGTLRFHIEA